MGEHALLSPSSAQRWLNCTPSARLEENIPDKAGAEAERGTHAHKFAELFNRRAFKQIPKKEFEVRLKELKEHPLYDGEMDNYAAKFSEYILEEYNALLKASKTQTADALFEKRLSFSEYAPGGYGTGDAVLMSDGVIEVVDFKYGIGVPVDAENNPQTMLYALGAYCEYSLLYKIEKIIMTIYQPRLDRVLTSAIEIDGLLKWADEVLREKANLAFDGAGKTNAGDHCKFCKIKTVCRANAERNLNLQNYEYKHPDILTDSEISDILLIVDRLVSWASDIKKYALSEAVAGKKWRGFKLIEGKSNRAYTDENAIIKILKENDYKEEDITVTKLLGIGEMEKLLKKPGFNKLIGEYVIKPQGKPTLALETDPRPELNQASLDFKDVEIET